MILLVVLIVVAVVVGGVGLLVHGLHVLLWVALAVLVVGLVWGAINRRGANRS